MTAETIKKLAEVDECFEIVCDTLIAARAKVDSYADDVFCKKEAEAWDELYDHISDFLEMVGAFDD